MELLLVAAAAGFVVWLIMRRNQPAPTPNGVAPAARAPSGGLGVSGCIAVVVVVGGTLYFGSSGNRVGDWGDHRARKACG